MQTNFENIIKNTNIVEVISSYLNLIPKGQNFVSLCPFHDDSSPSMSVSPTKGIFNCFACKTGGNALQFLIKYNKWSYMQAMQFLAEMQGINIDIQKYEPKKIEFSDREKDILAALEDAQHLFKIGILDEKNLVLKEYLKNRDLNENIIKRFGIGYADQNYLTILLKKHKPAILINASLSNENIYPFYNQRLTFPIKNIQGNIVGFSGRILSSDKNQVKYTNSAESNLFKKNAILFNYFEAKNSIDFDNTVIITEGFMDVIAYYKDKIENVVAIMGTALSLEHLKILKNKKIILNFDGDKAGIEATAKSLKILFENNFETYVISNSDNLDPDEYYKKYGPNSLKQRLDTKITGIEFLYQYYKKSIKQNDLISIETFLKNFSKFLRKQSVNTVLFYKSKIIQEIENTEEIIEKFIQISNESLPKLKTGENNKSFFLEEERKKVIKDYIINLENKIIYSIILDQALLENFNMYSIIWTDLNNIKIISLLEKEIIKKEALNNKETEFLNTQKIILENKIHSFEIAKNYSELKSYIKRLQEQKNNLMILELIKTIPEIKNKKLKKEQTSYFHTLNKKIKNID